MKVKKDCLWKQRTHKITKIGDSVWLSLFICNTVVCQASSTKFTYWASFSLIFIDSILGFVVPSVLTVIRQMSETHLICMFLTEKQNGKQRRSWKDGSLQAEPSHLYLRYLCMYLCWSTGFKTVKSTYYKTTFILLYVLHPKNRHLVKFVSIRYSLTQDSALFWKRYRTVFTIFAHVCRLR